MYHKYELMLQKKVKNQILNTYEKPTKWSVFFIFQPYQNMKRSII